MKHQASFLLAAAAAVALFAAPVFAQPAASAPAAGKPATTAPAKTATKTKAKRKMTCYDYAWQSADMQNCLAKQSAKPAAVTAPKAHKAKVTKAKATKPMTMAPGAAPMAPAK